MFVTRITATNSPLNNTRPTAPRKSGWDKFFDVFKVVGYFPLLCVLILKLASSFNWIDLAK